MGNSLVYTSVVSTKAQKEIVVSWNWYEDRLEGLGDRFVNEAKDAILKIVNNPNRYPINRIMYLVRKANSCLEYVQKTVLLLLCLRHIWWVE